MRGINQVLVVGLVGVAAAALSFFDPLPPTEATHQPDGSWSAGRLDLNRLITKVDVTNERHTVAGYDRDCGTGHACSFGQPWSDDVSARFGHNGCDTRNDMLRSALDDLEFEDGTDDCVVMAGTLRDPYTGRRIVFTKSEAHKVQIDHVYPLARAWDMGASSWPIRKRTTFANDPRNLVVADGPANASKSDQGPGEWLPLNAGYRCAYVARYLAVAIDYDLAITRGDHQTIADLVPLCSTRVAIEGAH